MGLGKTVSTIHLVIHSCYNRSVHSNQHHPDHSFSASLLCGPYYGNQATLENQPSKKLSSFVPRVWCEIGQTNWVSRIQYDMFIMRQFLKCAFINNSQMAGS